MLRKWSSWRTGFDVKHVYNYEYYFVDGIYQRNPQALYLSKLLFYHGFRILQLLFYFPYFLIWNIII